MAEIDRSRCGAEVIDSVGDVTMPMSYGEALRTNAIVSAGTKAGLTDRQIIGMLVDEINAMSKQMEALYAIAPRKIQMPDGSVVVWRCPEEMIPTA